MLQPVLIENTMNIYLDLNIFDRIEKKDLLNSSEKSIYEGIENLIMSGKYDAPYSNAHLNDLFRGYQKDPNFVEEHLKNIKRLTKDLCICQYWDNFDATWHYRDVNEFFNEKVNEWEFEPKSFEDLMSFDDMDIPNPINLYKLIPLPKEFKDAYKEPMFALMYPKSKINSNHYSLMEDIFDFQSRLKSDYSLYKSFKSYLVQNLAKFRKNPEMSKAIKTNFQDLPKHLTLIEIAETYTSKTKSSNNAAYSKVIETFYKFDLQGYKTDANFNNMFDDAMHAFYASHCEYFITNDERCKYKSEKTFEKLGIKTIVLKAEEYMQIN